MKIGFDVQYKPHDAVYAALRLSDSLRSMGYETTLFSTKRKSHVYGCEWDSMVVTPNEMSYARWLKGITHIIWPVPPTKESVQAVGKNIVTIALAPWDCLPGYTKKSFKMCAHTVAPCADVAKLLKKEYGLSNVSTMAWDSPLPVTRKMINGVNVKNPKVLVPLHASQGLRCDLDSLFDILTGVSARCPHASITVSYSPKCMSWNVLKEIRHFLHKNKKMTSVVDVSTCVSSLLLYGSHDLVLWPAEIEGFGLVGIESLYMGTPVIAYDMPPMSDIIIDGINGMLVPCDTGGAPNGPMFAKPDAFQFIESATIAIDNRLVDMNKRTKLGRKTKRASFNKAWKKIIEG